MRAGAPAQAPERPEEDEAQDDEPDRHLDRPPARLSTDDHELARIHETAPRAEPHAACSPREEEPFRAVLDDAKVASGTERGSDDDLLRHIALHVLIDVERQKAHSLALEDRITFLDDPRDHPCIRVVEPLGERRSAAGARQCIAGESEGTGRGDE